MKKHLFYTFLAIFVVTTIVTLAGIVGAAHISGGYLTALVSAFLIESAGAVVAIFRQADFFIDDEKKHADTIARMQNEYDSLQKRLDRAESVNAQLQRDVERFSKENHQLGEQQAELTSLRFRILALLGAESMNVNTIARTLDLNDPGGRKQVQSVIGKLRDDTTIEPDENNPPGYYRMTRKPQP
jgi:septal ring factor EnvC (AmiA/AmiB activator)